VDLASAREFESEVMKAAATGKLTVIDLLACKYIDSTVIAVLIRANKQLGGRLRIAVLEHSLVDRVLQLTALRDILPVFPSLSQALSA
jgi:anti-anti-sigma factor